MNECIVAHGVYVKSQPPKNKMCFAQRIPDILKPLKKFIWTKYHHIVPTLATKLSHFARRCENGRSNIKSSISTIHIAAYNVEGIILRLKRHDMSDLFSRKM